MPTTPRTPGRPVRGACRSLHLPLLTLVCLALTAAHGGAQVTPPGPGGGAANNKMKLMSVLDPLTVKVGADPQSFTLSLVNQGATGILGPGTTVSLRIPIGPDDKHLSEFVAVSVLPPPGWVASVLDERGPPFNGGMQVRMTPTGQQIIPAGSTLTFKLIGMTINSVEGVAQLVTEVTPNPADRADLVFTTTRHLVQKVARGNISFEDIDGEISDDQVPDDITIEYATTCGDADTLDGADGSAYMRHAVYDPDGDGSVQSADFATQSQNAATSDVSADVSCTGCVGAGELAPGAVSLQGAYDGGTTVGGTAPIVLTSGPDRDLRLDLGEVRFEAREALDFYVQVDAQAPYGSGMMVQAGTATSALGVDAMGRPSIEMRAGGSGWASGLAAPTPTSAYVVSRVNGVAETVTELKTGGRLAATDYTFTVAPGADGAVVVGKSTGTGTLIEADRVQTGQVVASSAQLSTLSATSTTLGQIFASTGTIGGNFTVSGNLVVFGTKSAAVSTPSHGDVLVYNQEATEVWLEDFGEACLEAGRARVALDAAYLDTVTVSAEHPLKVFVTLMDPAAGVFVVRDGSGFDVVELASGTSNACFAWRVVAKRRGFEDVRLRRH